MAINKRILKRGGVVWDVDYRDANGKRRYVVCKTYPEAKRVEAEKLAERGGNPHATMGEVAERWYALRLATVRKQSAEGYRRILDNHLIPGLGSRPVAKLRPTDLELFLSEKLGKLSPKTVSLIQSVLFGVLKHALRDGLIVSNPAAGLARELGLRRRSLAGAKVKAFTPAELERFLAASLEVAPREHALFFTMARTGLRISEACALEWDAIDIGGRLHQGRRVYQLTVRQSLRQDGEIDLTKTGKARRIDMSAQLREVIAAHKKAWLEDALATGDRGRFVFQREVGGRGEGRHYRKTYIQALFKNVCARAGLPLHHSPHTLRHTFASIHIQLGTPIGYLMKQLGHSSIAMTMDIYGHWLSESNPGAADRLDTAELDSLDSVFAGKKT